MEMVLLIKKNKNILLIVLGIMALVLLFIGLIFVFSNKDKDEKEVLKIGKNNYKIVNSNKYEGATVITNDRLKEEHCVDYVCIKDLTIYYLADYNNIELDIVNKGRNTATGYIKVIFKDLERTVAYKNLQKDSKTHYVIQLGSTKIDDTSDFEVRKLTAKEEKELKG